MPLAYGISNGVISENAKVRCRALLREVRSCCIESCPEVVIGLGAGVPPHSNSTKTLAEYTQEFLQETGSDIPTFVNVCDWHVFGTLAEIQWVVKKAQELYSDPHFVIVSQKRHIRRIRVICFFFFSEAVPFKFVVCGQKVVIPLQHEFFAYGKLLLVKIGCPPKQLRKLRYFVTNLIKKK